MSIITTPPRTFFYIDNFAEVRSTSNFEGIKPKVFHENRIVSGHVDSSSAVVHEALAPRRAFTSFGVNRILIHLAGDIVEAFLSTPEATKLIVKHNGNFLVADELVEQIYAQIDDATGRKADISIDANPNPTIFNYFGRSSVIVEIA